MRIASYCCILVLEFVVLPSFALAAEEHPNGSVFQDGISSDEQRARFQAKTRKALGLDDPIHTISLEANSIREYRITHENRVKLVLRQPENGMEFLVWNAHSLNEAREFIQLVKKKSIKSVAVRNGRILEILLKDSALD
jgi:hypothetical protein